MDFCSSHSHQLSSDHTHRPHRCVVSCKLCNDQGMAICALWRDNASVDLQGVVVYALNGGCIMFITILIGVICGTRHLFVLSVTVMTVGWKLIDARLYILQVCWLRCSYQALGVILGAMLMSIMKMVELWCQVCEIACLFLI